MALQPQPTTGFRFRGLPTELRHHVWDIAARQQAEDLVIFCKADYRFNPTKQLVSALLSTTRESRFCALRVFHLPLRLPNEGRVHINLELGTLAGNADMIRRYITCKWFREEPKKSYLPATPGPWRRGLTPVSSVIPIEERPKARRFVVIHFLDDPDHETLLRRSFPQGPTTFRPVAISARQRTFFFNLSLLNHLSHILFDLSTMGWAELNAKCPGQIMEWSEEDTEE